MNSRAGTFFCLALLFASAGMRPALADVSGQQRAQEAGHALMGSPAPPLVLKTIDGETIDLGSLGAAFHLRVTPTHIVIGRDGRIQYVGHLADGELDAALAAARASSSAPCPTMRICAGWESHPGSGRTPMICASTARSTMWSLRQNG
jgi:hypothetical protein